MTGSNSFWFANPGDNFYNGVATTSLRLAGATTLTNTYGTPTSSKKMSFGGWVKRATITKYCQVWGATTGGSVDQAYIVFNASNQLFVQILQHGVGNQFLITTDRVFRDTSAWYHLWVEIDSTDGTAADRVKVYINGVRETKAPTTTIADGSPDVIAFNVSGVSHVFGHPSATYGGDLYYSDWYFIDGLDVSPIDTVGEFKNGVFIPKSYTPSSFGTNGWHLKFDQVGVGTPSTSTIGADSSGKDTPRHWTSTADTNVVASDCALPDSPENNFATLTPLIRPYTVTAAETISDGNLNAFFNSNAVSGSFWSTFFLTSGKWYFEVYVKTVGGNADVGINNKPSDAGRGTYTNDARGNGYFYQKDGQKGINNSFSSYGATYTDGDLIGCAFDLDNNTITFFKDNASQGQISSVATPEDGFIPAIEGFNGTRLIANFGQDPSFAGEITAGTATGTGAGVFKYAPPSGHLAICTANLEEPTISPNANTQAVNHFGVLTYTGTDADGRTITSGDADIGGEISFTPDWVWVKARNTSSNYHLLFDSVRGATKMLFSNELSTESTQADSLSDFTLNGFTVSDNASAADMNSSSHTYVAWNWKAGGEPSADNSAGAGNTPTANSVKIDGSNLGSALAGTIPATRLSANTTAGFSVVTYTGDGNTGASVAHGLNAVPKIILIKNRDEDQSWVFNANFTTKLRLVLDVASTDSGDFSTYMGTQTDDRIVFGGTNHIAWNGSNDKMVAYCFAEKEGYSKFGTYTGNVDSNGTFVYTGFEPNFILLTNTVNAGYNWILYDGVRNPTNVASKYFVPDLPQIEQTFESVDLLSNGFKLRTTDLYFNAGVKFIYMAFAKNPFKYALAR